MLLRLNYLFLSCIFGLLSCAQPLPSENYTSITDTFTHYLGTTPVKIIKHTYNKPSPLFFVHLHDNESTAEKAAINLLEQYGGQLLSIENKEMRNIRFQLNNQFYTFDPNRMFSDSGIISNLKLLSSPDTAALRAVRNFGQFILSHLPDTGIIVAVHNNTDDRLSVLSFDTLPLKNETAAVTKNASHDIDDFILTTDSVIYNFYKNEMTNAILQREDLFTDDGSLSIFFGKKKRPYINVEAEHGHRLQQILLLEKLYAYLGLQKKNFSEKQ
ncbi:hypothetical protein [Flavisolibacter tropicus]|uniref:Uncharacterized protein n=1 Tax=Flavisolibacter tropicus TaxID=1492898 RepID=A0A172U1F6_9BACT|nr:hypothetical protein [Flavisolibacter tropicus]ANE53150.1 hypothetical protein SY85_24435 [Flavisolibacter tropicus]